MSRTWQFRGNRDQRGCGRSIVGTETMKNNPRVRNCWNCLEPQACPGPPASPWRLSKPLRHERVRLRPLARAINHADFHGAVWKKVHEKAWNATLRELLTIREEVCWRSLWKPQAIHVSEQGTSSGLRIRPSCVEHTCKPHKET